jgi:hypothetical protein
MLGPKLYLATRVSVWIVVQYPSTHGGEKLLLLSRGNHFSPLPLARPRVRRERHPRPSVRNAAASPLVPPCLTSTVVSLLAAQVILDRHVHALPSPRMRAPPFAGNRPVPAALISGEPLPCPILARAALLGFIFHFFFWVLISLFSLGFLLNFLFSHIQILNLGGDLYARLQVGGSQGQ